MIGKGHMADYTVCTFYLFVKLYIYVLLTVLVCYIS